MEISSRGSMNTSLRNAKIFEDDSDDEWSEMDTKSRDDVVSANNIKQESKSDHNTVDNKCTVKTEIKQELFDEETNFPINREAFKNIQIKKEVLDELTSPVKIDPYDNSDSNSRKSFKSTKITSYRKRDSPYKTVFERLEPSPSKLLSKLDFDEREEQPRKSSRRTEIETDPLVLSRRQKQIDYGKNTIGYDEYIRAVPKLERKLTDPQTPNKNIKYSRRGWDGLIKQWRLKLHKYDPDNNA